MMRALVISLLAVAACAPTTDPDAEARAIYPDLAALYGGDRGIYRGCAPSGGVCHNSQEFPDLHTVGSIVDNIGRPCNARRERPETIHDLCEPVADKLRLGGDAIDIAWLEPDATADPVSPRAWTVHLREPATSTAGLAVMRGDDELYDLEPAAAAIDATDPTRVAIALPETPPGPAPDPEEPDDGTYLAQIFLAAGHPNDPESIQLGDANRNGVFGAELDGRIIKPGDPARSYLMHRLTDPAAGPLMPRANCCFWTHAALRALECWIRGLAPDAGNALAPIDYDRCGPGTTIELLYPEPGPACETSGLCPVEAGPSGGTGFAGIYADIIVPRCSGSGCHNQMPVGGVDFATEEAAWTSVSARVVPGDPDASLLVRRLTPALCVAPACKTMPLGRAPLPDDELDRIRTWIEDGATRD